MRRGFLPVQDGALLAWSANAASHLSSDPTHFGISAGEAAAFAAAQANFAAAMAHVDPATRSRVTVTTKDEARVALENAARRINALVRGSGVASDADLTTLGLTVHKTTYRRVGPPTVMPVVEVASVGAPRIDLVLRETSSARVALPPDVSGAAVYHWIGDEPPADLSRWIVAAHVSRARLSVPIEAPPGTKVWFAAYYLNRRGERGPWGAVRTAYALGGFIPANLAAA